VLFREQIIGPRPFQGVVLLAAILVPCLVLVVLSAQMVVQDRELAGKRVLDSRRLEAERVTQALVSKLERLKLEVLREPRVRRDALTARVDGERLLFAWDIDASAARSAAPLAPGFAAALEDGARREVGGDHRAAFAFYETAIRLARTDAETAEARIAAVRAALNGGRRAAAGSLILDLLRSPVALVDDEGIPAALWGALAQLRATALERGDVQSLVQVLGQVIDREPPVTVSAVYMTSDLMSRLPMHDSPTLHAARASVRQRITDRLRLARVATELREQFTSVRAPSRGGAESLWTPVGIDGELWLLTRTPALNAPDEVVIAAHAGSALPEVASRLTLHPSPSAAPLGAGLPGLFVGVVDPPATGGPRSLLLWAVGLTLLTAVSGGILFWRDVQRDLRLAALRSQFVAGVSHELKTPLTAIRMFAETLRLDRVPQHKADAYLDTIVNESERLTRLLNNVLDFSKVEQGSRRYLMEPQSLAPIVRSAARTLRYPLEQQGFTLNLAIADEGARASCDADAIEQVVINLLSNAMKYSGSARTIDLRLTSQGDSAVIEVRDRGIGIPAAERSRIFEKFYRGEGDDHRRVAGTGLGLTLVQHTVRAHAGSVTVESTPGHGSTFAVRLPRIGQQAGVPA
jgi:signal transduction histidine kinase